MSPKIESLGLYKANEIHKGGDKSENKIVLQTITKNKTNENARVGDD
jgi:hypothetical protein